MTWNFGSVLPAVGAPSDNHVYDEDTFRHFLSLERRRAQLTGCSSLLVLVSVETHADSDHLSDRLAAALFSGLGVCLREVDFSGWYLESRVAAAVLPQREEPSSEVIRSITDRIAAALRGCVPAAVTDRLRVRVVRVGKVVA